MLKPGEIKKELLRQQVAFHLRNDDAKESYVKLKQLCKNQYNIKINPDIGEWLIRNGYVLSQLFPVATDLGKNPLEWTEMKVQVLVAEIKSVDIKEVRNKQTDFDKQLDKNYVTRVVG